MQLQCDYNYVTSCNFDESPIEVKKDNLISP